MDKENILARVGGEHVAAALNTLPDPAVGTEERRETVIEVPELGQVRFRIGSPNAVRPIATYVDTFVPTMDPVK